MASRQSSRFTRWIVYRGLRVALRARTDYEFFLAAGLAAATALQILLIAGGALGVLPLSGVVTPFLSYGRSAMLANFVVIAILLSISSPLRRDGDAVRPFRAPVTVAGIIFAIAGTVVLAKAAYVQGLRSSAVVGEGTLVVQADGVRRYQYNPRLQEIMREIPKGTIYDRNGLPLATSNWDELEKHRAEYQQLGIDIDRACPRTDSRHYPVRRPDVRPAGRPPHAHPLGAPAIPLSSSAIPPAACAATTTGPRWWR